MFYTQLQNNCVILFITPKLHRLMRGEQSFALGLKHPGSRDVIAPNPALFRRTLGDQRRWPAR